MVLSAQAGGVEKVTQQRVRPREGGARGLLRGGGPFLSGLRGEADRKGHGFANRGNKANSVT